MYTVYCKNRICPFELRGERHSEMQLQADAEVLDYPSFYDMTLENIILRPTILITSSVKNFGLVELQVPEEWCAKYKYSLICGFFFILLNTLLRSLFCSQPRA